MQFFISQELSEQTGSKLMDNSDYTLSVSV